MRGVVADDRIGDGGEKRHELFHPLRLLAPGEPGHVAGPLAEAEFEDVGGMAEQFQKAIGSLFLDDGVGILLPLQIERGDVQTRGEQNRRGPQRGVAAGVVTVVGDDDMGCESPQQRGLPGRQRCSHRGHDARHAGVIDGDGVEVPFDEDGPIHPPHGVFRPMQVVQQTRLVEDLGFR